MKAKKIYSNAVCAVTRKAIPFEILEAMGRLGWNEFGVYEVVLDALKDERKKAKAGEREAGK